MPDLLFKAPDGSIQKITESETVSLDEIDNRIAEVNEHLNHLQDLRAQYISLSGDGSVKENGGADNGQAANADGSAGANPPAAGDQTQGDPAGQAAADGAQGQVSDPGAGQAAPAAPQLDANGNVIPPEAPGAGLPQPMVNA